MITAETLKKLLELEAAATPGPWFNEVLSPYEIHGKIWVKAPFQPDSQSCDYINCIREPNAALIAEARNCLKQLIEEVQMYRKLFADSGLEKPDVIRPLVEEVIKWRALLTQLNKMDIVTIENGIVYLKKEQI